MTARRYRPVPPDEERDARRGPRCLERGAGGLAATRATVNSSSGSTRSRRWWGTSACSAGVGLAVPMSMPR